MSTKETLRQVRAKFKRNLQSMDSSGFEYHEVFGCLRGEAFHTPHVLVRAELRQIEDNVSMFEFKVVVDFHLPVGATVADAEHFKQTVQAATRKAKWALGVVKGQEWHRDDVF